MHFGKCLILFSSNVQNEAKLAEKMTIIEDGCGFWKNNNNSNNKTPASTVEEMLPLEKLL